MGSVSAPFKKLMYESSKPWYERKWKDKIAAGFTNSASQSGDKLNTLQTLAIFAAQHGMIWVGLDLLPGNNNSKGSVDDLNRLGSYLGAMAQSNADQGPDQGPIASDLKTAEYLGKRVATLTSRFK
jgi:multimeric flavodoxin WrbA